MDILQKWGCYPCSSTSCFLSQQPVLILFAWLILPFLSQVNTGDSQWEKERKVRKERRGKHRAASDSLKRVMCLMLESLRSRHIGQDIQWASLLPFSKPQSSIRERGGSPLSHPTPPRVISYLLCISSFRFLTMETPHFCAALLIHCPPREAGLRFESDNSLKLFIVFYLRNSSVPTLSKDLREN